MLRNVLVLIVLLLFGGFVFIFFGLLIIERIFRVEGVGGIYIEVFNNRDYLLIMGYLMFYIVIGLFVGLIVDILYGIIDLRIRVGVGK